MPVIDSHSLRRKRSCEMDRRRRSPTESSTVTWMRYCRPISRSRASFTTSTPLSSMAKRFSAPVLAQVMEYLSIAWPGAFFASGSTAVRVVITAPTSASSGTVGERSRSLSKIGVLCDGLAIELSDYINANYIDGWKRQRAYIATQAPVPGTIQDFWRMVWEENSSIIVMATREVEKGKIKCHKYWPDEGGVVQCGAVEVGFVSFEEVNDDFSIRKLILTDQMRTQSREITQYVLKSWPDQGVPNDPAVLIRLILNVRRAAEAARARGDGAGPVVVHCSAGIGRTGTYFALDISMQRLDELSTIDISAVVSYLRLQRAGMVQTLVQYRFLYEALLAYYRTSGRAPRQAGWSGQDNRASLLSPAEHQQLVALSGHGANPVNENPDYLVRALNQL
eukprot:UC1_evm1s2012